MSQNTETTMISEREAVLREREAFRRGAMMYCGLERIASDFKREAAIEFPLPKVTRPRVVQYGDYAFRVVDGIVEWTGAGRDRWSPTNDGTPPNCALGVTITVGLVLSLAELVARPTEEVDADA